MLRLRTMMPKTVRHLWLLLLLTVTMQAHAAYLTSLDQVTTGYYRVISEAYNTTMAMSETSTGTNNVFCDTPNENDYMQVWYIDVKASTETSKGVQIKNAVSERWIDRAGTLIQTYTNHSSTPFTIVLTETGFTIARGNGFHHQQSGHDVVSFGTSSDASKWQLEAVEVDEAALSAQKEEYNNYVSLVNNKATITTALAKYFTDNSCSELKDDYKSYTDDNLTAAMETDGIPAAARQMAIKVKNNDWTEYADGWEITEKTFRIGSYAPVSKESRWRGITKVGYALSPNSDPTGIYVQSGDVITVYVSEIPSGQSVMLRNVPRSSGSGEGYALNTGFNILKMQSEGMLYVDYEVDNTTNGGAPYTLLSSYPNVTVHIEGGQVNGAFSVKRGDTDADWEKMQLYLFKKYDYLQLRSRKLIFNMLASKVMEACPTKMVELLDQWDKVVEMEHNIMGLDAEFPGYFNTPMMAVSITGNNHMFASTYGTYYNENTLGDVMKYENLFAGGSLWGPAHEIGHINQAAINIIGQSEVSNNLFSNIAVYLNGHLTSRTEYISTTFKNMADNIYWQNRTSLWERTHLYFQLYQFFHVQGYMPNFYQNFFKALRADPTTRVQNTFIDATYDYLKFYKMACEVSGYDLTEFFQAYGFFVVPEQPSQTVGSETRDAFWVGDYGTYYLVVTQEMIDAAIAEVKALNLPKANVVFIEDRISAPDATYTGAEEGTKKTTFSGYEYGKGDVGQYTDFIPTVSATGYKASYLMDADGNLDVVINHDNGTGAVGFKVYDKDENLVYLANTYNFTIPKAVYDKIKGTAFKIMAAGPDGADQDTQAKSDYIDWVVKDSEGNVLKEYSQIVVDGQTITAYPEKLVVPFISLPTLTAFTYPSDMNKEKEVVATVTTPFKSSSTTQAYYYNVTLGNGYLYQTEADNVPKPALTKTAPNGDAYRWAFYGNPYDGYRLKSKVTGQWLNAGTDYSNGKNPVLSSTEATDWKIAVASVANKFDLCVPGTSRFLNDYTGAGNNIAYWSGGSGFAVSGEQLLPMPTTTIHTASHLSSFSYPSALTVPDDVNIFIATASDNNSITLQWLDTKVVPANTGVLLYSDGGGEKILQLGGWIYGDVVTAYSSNILKNTASEGFTVGSSQNVYALRAGQTAFARVATGVAFPTQKAYMELASGDARLLTLNFGDNPTNVVSVLNDTTEATDNRFVNLNGQLVSRHYKGIVIHNGKKILQR